MAYHADFWILAGTAAPVIAVAVALNFGGLSTERGAWLGPSRGRLGGPSDPAVERLIRLAGIGVRAAWGLDLVVLVLALVATARESDVVPSWLPIVLLVLSGFGLLVESGARNRIAVLEHRAPTPAEGS